MKAAAVILAMLLSGCATHGISYGMWKETANGADYATTHWAEQEEIIEFRYNKKLKVLVLDFPYKWTYDDSTVKGQIAINGKDVQIYCHSNILVGACYIKDPIIHELSKGVDLNIVLNDGNTYTVKSDNFPEIGFTKQSAIKGF